MTDSSTDRYSAAEQGLGYIYQARLALLHLLQLPEDTAVVLEKDDDLDFIDGDGGKSLASLKHKAVGDRLTDLSTDFWKSVNIWLKFPTFNSEPWSSFRLCYSRHLSLRARAGHRRACRMVGTVVRSVRSNKKYTKRDFILVKANTRNDNPRNPGERLPEPVIAI